MLRKTKELDQPIGITPGDQPANRNYTLTPKMAWAGDHYTPTPSTRGVNSDRGNKGQH